MNGLLKLAATNAPAATATPVAAIQLLARSSTIGVSSAKASPTRPRTMPSSARNLSHSLCGALMMGLPTSGGGPSKRRQPRPPAPEGQHGQRQRARETEQEDDRGRVGRGNDAGQSVLDFLLT